MKAFFMLISIMPFFLSTVAQNTFRAKITNDHTKEILKGATVFIIDLKIVAVSNANGTVTIPGIPNGKITIGITYTGLLKSESTYSFPLTDTSQIFEISLTSSSEELEDITVQTTRTNQNIRDVPTRVEALPLEELDEKSVMRPGDIKMLLGEATGIHVQQISAVGDNSSVRIQGLNSRYTQLLRDGMPIYAGFSGNLSLVQISPLDLKQVEFIKGAASTLYGGGAIAGLINLISRTPAKAPELNFLINGTSAKGADVSFYYAQQWQHIGTTIFASYNTNGSYDPSGEGFSAVPKTRRLTINPKVFFRTDEHNTGWFGINTVCENRLGGDMRVIENRADNIHQYFQHNETFNFSTELSFTHRFTKNSMLNLKNTTGYFDRQVKDPGFDFKGKQLSSFSEVSFNTSGEKTSWIFGFNLITDQFAARQPPNYLNYNLTTLGGFIQSTYKASKWLSLESGLRLDKNNPAPGIAANAPFLLPRINALLKLSNHFTSRFGGGFGYKMPTVFDDQSESVDYKNIKPLNMDNAKADRSYGINTDLNYRGSVGDNAFIHINQLFFYTHVSSPLILQNNEFVNAPGYLSSQGSETNIKLSFDEFVFYLGYTFTNAKEHFRRITA